MSGLVPIPARPAGASVPTRRTARVEPASSVRDVREEPRHAAPPSRACHRACDAPLSAPSALSLQAAPVRRGLRADACERRRYQAAYGAAMGLAPAPRPSVERAA